VVVSGGDWHSDGTAVSAVGAGAGRKSPMSDARTGSGRYWSIFRPELFAGQVVIVTGGGSGIGRCTAHELASLGAAVALVGRRPEKLARVRAEIVEDGGHATIHPCDISEEEAVTATVADILQARMGASTASSTTPAGSSRRHWRPSHRRAGRRWCAPTSPAAS
jgi:NADPH:quinone reductase-like Zn-dependent oxidoreductase